MSSGKKNNKILKTIISECEKHLLRMNNAYEKISPSLPITPKRIFNLSNDEIEHIDQFIFRFSELQDALGQKLFKSVLDSLGEDLSNKSAIDIFNRLEQLEIINDYENWKELRDIRNDAAHEYEENENEAAEKINLLLKKRVELEKYYNDILAYLKGRKII